MDRSKNSAKRFLVVDLLIKIVHAGFLKPIAPGLLPVVESRRNLLSAIAYSSPHVRRARIVAFHLALIVGGAPLFDATFGLVQPVAHAPLIDRRWRRPFDILLVVKDLNGGVTLCCPVLLALFIPLIPFVLTTGLRPGGPHEAFVFWIERVVGEVQRSSCYNWLSASECG